VDDPTEHFSPVPARSCSDSSGGGYTSIQDLTRDHPDITAEQVAMVTAEILKVTGLMSPGSPTPTPAPRRPRRQPTQPLAYQLKIALAGSKPPIWRRFIVPGDIGLDRLHDLIQVVMKMA
jgi:hypothetical protein